MNLSLSTLAITLGLIVASLQVYGLANPSGFAQKVRGFPRSVAWGYPLMLLATAWFIFNLSQEAIADFAAWKNIMYMAFAVIGLGSCFFVRDFLAVRGLAVVLLLLAKLMVDTGRPHLANTSWVLIFQAWAYVFVVAGIAFTISPWRMRDLLNWSTASEKRIKVGCAARLAFALLIIGLGVTVF